MAVRMRFPAKALEELKKDDPGTPVTLHFIRALVRQGLVPCVKVGRRWLLNYDALLAYLENPTQGARETAPGIRRIVE